jgi:excisionase family DNA binding protein
VSEAELMNVGEAAAFLRLHRSTVSRMVSAGRIPHVMFGRAPRFSRTGLIRWFEAQATAVPAAPPTAAPTTSPPRLTPKHVGRRRAAGSDFATTNAVLGVVR